MVERQDEQRMNWIIDIHTHIYPVALARRAMEVTGHENDDFKKLPIRENLLARMREAGVDLSVNLPVVSKPQNQGCLLYTSDRHGKQEYRCRRS